MASTISNTKDVEFVLLEDEEDSNFEKYKDIFEKSKIIEDYIKYIEVQKLNADIIVNFYEINNCIKCKIHILNNIIFNKLFKYFIKYNYEIYENTIELNENIEQIYKNENISNYYICNNLNNYYEEILILLILYIY